MKASETTIKTHRGTMEVPCYPVAGSDGLLVVSKVSSDNNGYVWTVTHVRTGRAFMTFDKMADAMTAAENLLENFPKEQLLAKTMKKAVGNFSVEDLYQMAGCQVPRSN